MFVYSDWFSSLRYLYFLRIRIMTTTRITNPKTPPRAGLMVLQSTGDLQITDGNVQAPDTPVGVQNGSSVNGIGGASTDGSDV